MAPTTPTSTATTSISRRIVRAPSASHAALSQASGYARFNQLARSLSAPTLPSRGSNTQEDTADQVTDPKEQERRAVEEDKKVIEAEILAYEAAGILDENHPESEDLDLLTRTWICSGIGRCVIPTISFIQNSYSSYSQSRLSIRCCGKSHWMFGYALRANFLFK
jgi:hypothetical protein